MEILCVTSRSCSVLLDPEGLYEAREKHELFLDGERLGEEYRSITSRLRPIASKIRADW